MDIHFLKVYKLILILSFTAPEKKSVLNCTKKGNLLISTHDYLLIERLDSREVIIFVRVLSLESVPVIELTLLWRAITISHKNNL